MLVQIQSSALVSRWCNGTHKTLLRSWSWFDSRSGCLEYGPWVCRIACQLPKLLDQVRLLDGLLTTRPASVPDRTADFDSARRGSIPRRATEMKHVLGVCRIAREPAKLVDQVRFLAGTLNDAGARRHGNRLQPGRSGFDSHRRL